MFQKFYIKWGMVYEPRLITIVSKKLYGKSKNDGTIYVFFSYSLCILDCESNEVN